ncbi:hydantoinase B/oxoprolinase family protein [Marivibrio halodurans]|uniref:Hydantoinase B/oxoprolinase family protein n=1 Tax=Marivibrio halodurans TaxID=2039722 RepID=A0A8J7V318_9PROT|nr:hydantoinase B/oxoprolinase family protein [Marivibrio halodurans]MBP5857472.1 hydantoinase B/oxoprolinase family protein [Marivibrio halodurans]
MQAQPSHIEDAGEAVFEPRADRVTYEILKHRLWQINEEQATTIRRVSGSPIASEVQDYNVGIATADGQLVACGMSVLAHVTALSHVIRNCLKVVGAPRIRPGDMYITNDPWMGAVHQNDVALVAPIHRDGTLVAWASSVIHHADVGGPAPGSWNLDAYDAFQEAPRYRFLRIVENGEIANEIMATMMTNSRTPSLAELDLRAQVAAAGVVLRRMDELYDKYGAETVSSVMEDCLSDTEILLRRRVREIPDGVWRAEEHVDHDGHEDTLSTVRLTLRKQGDRLAFDFTESDPQARGLINCTRSTLESAPLSAVLTHLCDGMAWNEGALRLLDIESKSGTVVDCAYPAPVASGVINAGWAALNASAAAVARMMLRAENCRDKAMAGWAGAPYGVNVFGMREDGRSFGTMLGLSGLQGGGARSFGDGYDTAGYLHSPRCGAMNVETAEARYPILHLFRRLARDSGGPGRHRGGRGVEMAFATHGASAAEIIVTSFGNDHSGSPGIAGGLPGAGAAGAVIRTEGTIAELCARCTDRDALLHAGEAETLPAKARVDLKPGEVFVAVTHGGGGFGDPFDRAPEAVAHDVEVGAVDRLWAERLYGVRLAGDGTVDRGATDALRAQTRWSEQDGIEAATLDRTALVEAPTCPDCATTLSPEETGAGPKFSVAPLGAAGPLVSARWGGECPRFRLVTAYCPNCSHSIESLQVRVEG